MKTGTYFAESALEAIRLLKKTDLNLTSRQLQDAQLHHLHSGARIADIGSGVGIISSCMEEILTEKNISHSIFSVDLSFSRLLQSNLYEGRAETVSHLVADAKHLPFEEGTLDFIFSRFLFEYLADPLATLREMVRITRPGGKIVTSDLDLNCLCLYPVSETFNEKLHTIARVLQKHRLFDAYIGRKLYALYRTAGLEDIDIRIESYGTQYGALSESACTNWKMKIRHVCEGPRKFNVEYGFDIDEFRDEFIEVVENPERFSYAPLITIEGIKG